MCKKLICLVSFVLVLGMAAGVANADIAIKNGLVGYYPLDEGEGDTAHDMSDMGHHGIRYGGITWISPGYRKGGINNDGETGSVIYLGTWNPAEGTGQLSLALWMRWDHAGPSQLQGLFGKRDTWGPTGKMMFYFQLDQNDDTFHFAQYNQSVISPAGSATPVINEWAHAAVTFDGTTARIYLNGEPIQADPFSFADLPTAYMGIGATHGYGAGPFSGDLDEVYIYNRALSQSEIKVVMTGIPGQSSSPNPADEAIDVPRDVVLEWTVGEFADKHDVYLGTNFDDVNDADRNDPRAVLFVQDLDVNILNVGRLDFDQSYYWRVDEVNAPPSSTIIKGEVWSFTVEPFSYPIAGERITATASSGGPAQGPENTMNSSGWDNGRHSTEPTDMWLSNIAGPQPTWIQYEFDKDYKLHQMWVWNHNTLSEPIIGYGIKEAIIEYSADGANWTTLGTTHEFGRATAAAGYEHNTTVDFGVITVKYVRLTANSNWGDLLPQYGLSEVRFLYKPVRAREPSPDSGATDVDVDVTLGFRAGREAAKHDVYFGADPNALTLAGSVNEPLFDTASLDLTLGGQSYYWRVDEVNDAETPTTWPGDIWNLSTGEFIVVDDFESYNDIDPPDPESNTIFGSWIDGFQVPTNGALVGYDPAQPPDQPSYTEHTIVHGGNQSMPLSYSNTGAATSSEAEHTFAVPQDWTKHGVQTLTLWFRGTVGNTGQLYVKVNGSKVVYDGDAADMQLGWQAWNIELASFGVDLQSVTTLVIGVEGFGATGTLFLDDIRLYPYSRQSITPAEPNNAGLVGHWALDGNVQDSSGLGNHGTANGAPTYVVGKFDQAMSFGGIGDYVTMDGVADDVDVDSNDITIAVWVNMTSDTAWYPIISCNTATGGNVGWLAVDNGYADFDDLTGTMFVTDNNWHHLAYTRIGDSGYLYVDGVLEGTHTQTGLTFSADNLWSIGQEWDPGPTASQFLIGTVDDARIYNYGLSYAEIAWLVGRTLPFDKPF